MKNLGQPEVVGEICRRLRMLSERSARRWGRMTAHQAVCHLEDSYRLAMGERPFTRRPMALAGLQRVAALYVVTRWPRGTPTLPEVDAEIGGSKPEDFARDREMLLATVERFGRQPRDFTLGPHPMFGKMSESDWMRWGYLHTNHHLRQFGC